MAENSVAKKLFLLFVFVTLLSFGFTPTAYAQKRILFLGWNVESGGNNPATISEQLAKLEGYDIVGLCEVRASNVQNYVEAVEKGEGAKGSENVNFQHKTSKSGGSDRLVIIWDAKRFDIVGDPIEMDDLNSPDKRHRSPFAVILRIKETDTKFFFMVNHLARGDADLRNRQAKGLSKWANQQDLPIIAVGDYNFDYSIDDGTGNQGFSNMLSSCSFKWIRPSELYQTGLHEKYYSVLDFVFVANKPYNWSIDSKILVDPKIENNRDNSDHRAVQGRILIN